MDKKMDTFHTLCRKYFIDILDNFRNEIKPIIEICNAINNFEDDRIKALYKAFADRNPFWVIRREIIEVILERIEEIAPERFKTIDDIKKSIISACEKASIDKRIHFAQVSKETVINICSEEKEKFYCYVNNITEKELCSGISLFYRRTISKFIAGNIC